MRYPDANGAPMGASIAGPTADALHSVMLLRSCTLERSCSNRAAGGAIYCAIIRVSAFSRAALGRWTYPDDSRAVRSDDRRLARALVRAILCTLTGTSPQRWTFRPDAHSRPIAADICGRRSPFLSMAHSRGWLACIVSSCNPVGVDIETLRTGRSWHAISLLAFGPLERAHALRRGPEAFLRIWTVREALAKATNKGFALVVDRTDYAPAYPFLQDLIPFRSCRTPSLRSFLAHDFCLASCVMPRAPRAAWPARPGSHKAVAAVIRACGGVLISL